MELEEMQAAWSQMSQQLEAQKKLTDEIILKMTKQRYQNHWNKIATPEKIGGVICYAAVIALIINFNKLDTLALQISGVLCIIILTILPILSLKTIRDLQHIDISENNYKQTMEAFVKGKKRFINFQKLNIGISFLFMLLTIPVSAKLFNGENLFETMDKKLLIALPVCFFFFYLLIRFVSKCYKGVIKNSEAILEDIKE